jgi:hypothetical protein
MSNGLHDHTDFKLPHHLSVNMVTSIALDTSESCILHKESEELWSPLASETLSINFEVTLF